MDEYAKQLAKQDSGKPCEHCNSSWGHTQACPLLNNKTPKQY